jgi:hypothetical protein
MCRGRTDSGRKRRSDRDKPIVNFTRIILLYTYTQSQSIIAHKSPFHKHSESEMLRAARRGSLFHSGSLIHARCYYWANDPELTIPRAYRNAKACAVCIAYNINNNNIPTCIRFWSYALIHVGRYIGNRKFTSSIIIISI